MELILEQMPIVIRSLNVGFLQTLKALFCNADRRLPPGTDHCLRVHVPVQASQLFYAS